MFIKIQARHLHVCESARRALLYVCASVCVCKCVDLATDEFCMCAFLCSFVCVCVHVGVVQDRNQHVCECERRAKCNGHG